MSRHAMSSKQASQVKRRGHAREREFNRVYGYEDDDINHSGASADCEIREGHEILEELHSHIGSSSRSVSVKGGNTIQIHLGNLPELTDKERYRILSHGPTCVDHGVSFAEQVNFLKTPSFWNKYLKKGDVMAYSYDDGKHVFFNMDDVVNFICERIEWRLLHTGRLKGDFVSGNSKKQLLTYEYRSKKKSFVLGAHGGSKGREFIEVLKANLRHYIA
tara:strand:+ start:123 stop:776 length:654 start_codon:yes stop_codon:yes gene_type:complete